MGDKVLILVLGTSDTSFTRVSRSLIRKTEIDTRITFIEVEKRDFIFPFIIVGIISKNFVVYVFVYIEAIVYSSTHTDGCVEGLYL